MKYLWRMVFFILSPVTLSVRSFYRQITRSGSVRNLLASAQNDSEKLDIIEKWIWATTWSDQFYYSISKLKSNK
jgi:hypothetical protein